MKNKKALIAIIILVLAGVLMVLRLRNKTIKLETSVVTRSTVEKTVTASGETSAIAQNVKRSATLSTIKKIHVPSQTQVEKDDVIVTLDQTALRAASDKAWAEYLLAKASLDNYNLDLESEKANVNSKRITRDRAQEEYNGDKDQDNKEALRIAEANYTGAVADLELLRSKKSYFEQNVNATYSGYLSAYQNYTNPTITAPSDGTLALDDIEEGEQVTIGQRLFSIITPDGLEFVAEVDETDISYVKLEQPVSLSLDSYPDQEFEGAVREISGVTKVSDSGGTVIAVNVLFQTNKIAPVVGLNGEARFKVDSKENVLAVDSSFLEEDNDGAFVFVENQGKASKRRVKTGLSGEEFTEVMEGLAEGEKVIKAEDLKEGDKVNF